MQPQSCQGAPVCSAGFPLCAFEIDVTQFYVVDPGMGGVCRAPDAADTCRGGNKTMARKDGQQAPGEGGAAVCRKLQEMTGALQPHTGSSARASF